MVELINELDIVTSREYCWLWAMGNWVILNPKIITGLSYHIAKHNIKDSL